MITRFDELLDGAARALGELAGEQPAVAQVVGPIAGLLTFVAADVDSHISWRLQEAEDITAILRRVRGLVPADDAQAIDRAMAAAPARPADYAAGNIEAYSAQLRQALTRAHSWLEGPAGRHHPDVLADVWTFLHADAERRGRQAVQLW